MSKYEPPAERTEAVDLEYVRREFEHRTRRAEILGWTVGVCVVAIALVVAIYLIWQANKGPSTGQQLEHQEKLACTQAGGTWLKVTSGDSSEGTCTYGRLEP